jgi:peptidoglycan glycosyltransferase
MIPRIVSAAAAALLPPLLAYAIWTRDRLTDGQWVAVLAGGWILVLVAIWPRLPRPSSPTSRATINAAIIMTSIFGLLAAQLVRVQAIQSDDVQHRFGTDPVTDEVIANPRLARVDLAANRGAIVDRDGEVIAETQVIDGSLERVYPDPSTAYVAGYYSPLLYGRVGLEATYDEELQGTSGGNPMTEEIDKLLGRTEEGHTLVLTLDADLQRLAHDLLDGRAGAVVLIDVQSGAVLTLASNPHYDPNQLDVLDTDDRDAAIAYWEEITDDPSRPLVLRATSGLYTPGSTFKVVTAAAAIDAGKTTPDTVYTDDGILDVDGRVIIERNRPDDSIDRWTLTEGLAFSLNVVFAQVGLDLGADLLERYAKRFGFEEDLPFDLPLAESSIATAPDFLETDTALADTAFGQGELQVTPLHMALIAAAIADGGVMMEPYLVESVDDQDGDTLSRHEGRTLRRPISNQTAAQVRAMMINAVNNGYVSAAQIPGVTVGGKTGTAETFTGEAPHAWFIGFAGEDEPRYAVAVVLEHGGSGTFEPVSIGREMLLAAIQAHD